MPPGSGDNALFGTGTVVRPGNPGNRPHYVYFGNFRMGTAYGLPNPVYVDGGNASVLNLSILDDAWTFDFHSGATAGGAMPPALTGGCTVVNTLSIGDTVHDAADLTVRNGGIAVGQTLDVGAHGDLQVVPGAWVRVGSASPAAADGTVQVNAGGTVRGQGEITAKLLNQAGTVQPGATLGTLGVSSFNQQQAGVLRIEIGGRTPGSYDVLNVRGQATLSGSLQVVLVNGFTPAPGDQFAILNASAIAGAFLTRSLPAVPGIELVVELKRIVVRVASGSPPSLGFDNVSRAVNRDAGRHTIIVQRRGSTASAVSVHYKTVAIPGGAVPDIDYTHTSGTLAIAAGATEGTIQIPILKHATQAVSFTVVLENPGGGATLASDATCTVTIHPVDGGGTNETPTTPIDEGGEGSGGDSSIVESPDDPYGGGDIQFAPIGGQIFWRGQDYIVLTIERTGTDGGTSVVWYTTNYTAVAGADYREKSRRITFRENETQRKIRIPILDAPHWGNKELKVRLKSPRGGRLGPNRWVKVGISDSLADSTWLDFAFPGAGNGTPESPYNSIAQAVANTPAGGVLTIKSGTSSERPALSTPVMINTSGGAVTVGQ